jgi:ABC-2 type transport system permease protein
VSELLLVARREFVERARDRTFLISNLVILLILIGASIGPLLFGGGDEPYRIGAVGPEAEALLAAAEDGQETFDVNLRVSEVPDRAAAEAAVADEELDAALDGPGTVLVRDDLPTQVEALLTVTAQGLALDSALADAGVPPEARAELAAPAGLDVQTVADEDRPVLGPPVFIAAGASVLLYGLLLILGQFIAQGIVEEKASRVVEVLLSAIRPTQLLGGKVLGLGALGFLQLLVLAVVGVGATLVTGVLELPPGSATAIALALGWFVLGYAQYASLFAVTGSVVSRVEELQGILMLAYVPAFVAFFAAQAALNDPTGTISRVTALLPFTAPLVQPIRVAAGVAPAWEPVAAAAIGVATAVALVPVAARFYTGGVLEVHRRIGFGAAWRAAR